MIEGKMSYLQILSKSFNDLTCYGCFKQKQILLCLTACNTIQQATSDSVGIIYRPIYSQFSLQIQNQSPILFFHIWVYYTVTMHKLYTWIELNLLSKANIELNIWTSEREGITHSSSLYNCKYGSLLEKEFTFTGPWNSVAEKVSPTNQDSLTNN